MHSKSRDTRYKVPKSKLSYSLNDRSPTGAVKSIRALLEILARIRGVVVDEQPNDGTAPSNISIADVHISVAGSNDSHYDSTTLYLEDFLNSLCEALDTVGRDAEADAFRHALQLYQTDRELRTPIPYQSISNGQLSDDSFKDLEFLVEAWLEALNSAESARKLPAPLPAKSSNTRAMTLAEKILAHHAFSLPSPNGLKSGEVVRVSIDWIIASELSWVVRQTKITVIYKQKHQLTI